MFSLISNLFGFKPAKKKTSQDKLGFHDIASDMIVVDKDNFRMVLECSKVNMKSKDKNGVRLTRDSFRETINMLRFSHQWQRVTIALDLDGYFKELSDYQSNTDHPFRKKVLGDVRKFLEQETGEQKHLSTNVYLIIGYNLLVQQNTEINRGVMATIKSLLPFGKAQLYKYMSYEERLEEVSNIFRKLESDLKTSLRKVGSTARRLNNDELNELIFLSNFHETALLQRWGDIPYNGIPVSVGDAHAE